MWPYNNIFSLQLWIDHLWSHFNQGFFVSINGLSEQVVSDGKVVDQRPGDDKEVPDGMGEGDSAVAFEEDDPDDVDDAAQFQFCKSSFVFLKIENNSWKLIWTSLPHF